MGKLRLGQDSIAHILAEAEIIHVHNETPATSITATAGNQWLISASPT